MPAPASHPQDSYPYAVVHHPYRTVFLALLIAGLTIGSYAAQTLYLESLRADFFLTSLFFDKPNVPIGRVFALAVYGVFAFTVLTLAWRPVRADWSCAGCGTTPSRSRSATSGTSWKCWSAP